MKRPNLYSWSVWAIISVVVLCTAGIAVVRVKERSDEIAAASRVASDYASVIAEQVADATLAIDLSLREIIDHKVNLESKEAYLSEAGSELFYQRITAVLKSLPQADVITLTDEKGKVIASTRSFPPGTSTFPTATISPTCGTSPPTSCSSAGR